MRRAEAFNRTRNLAQLKHAVDPICMAAQRAGAGRRHHVQPQCRVLLGGDPPAALFRRGRPATPPNYGSAGAGMAHEISHSFDELGNIYDAQGRLRDWWTAEDRTRYAGPPRA